VRFSTVDFEVICNVDFSVSKLLKPVDYFANDGTQYRIPLAQPTDFASIPQEFWGAPLFLIPYGWYSLPAAGHDSAYQNLLLKVNADGSTALANLTEDQSNDLLLEMMQAMKPNPTTFEKLQMSAIYHGVTIGGWHAFKVDRS
jgi:Protein of unknown function (DUF1353)